MYLTTDQLKLFILPEFVKAFKLDSLNSTNLKLKNNSFFFGLNISPKIFCYVLNNKEVLNLVCNEPLIVDLNDEIVKSISFADNEKNIMVENLVFLLLVVLCSSCENTIKGIVNAILEWDKNLKRRIIKFLLNLREIFVAFYSNPSCRLEFAKDIISFHKIIATYTATKTNDIISSSIFSHIKLPSYVTKTLTNRIFLCMMLPDQDKVRICVQHLSFPRTYLITHKLKDDEARISPFVFKRLIKYIPNRRQYTSSSIDDFEKFIWKTHIHRHPKLSRMIPRYNHKKFDMAFENNEIIAQVIAFTQPNWKQIWHYMRWPCMPEILKRLNFLKENTDWKLESPELASYLLSIKS